MSVPIPQDNLVLPTGKISQSWQRFLTLLRSQISDVTTYAPTVFATTGSITTASARARYQVIGDQVVLNGAVTVTNNGTGGGTLFVTLPTAIHLPQEQTVGSCIQGNGTPLVVFLGDQIGGFPFNPSYRALAIQTPTGTYPGASTATIYYSIVYWIQ